MLLAWLALITAMVWGRDSLLFEQIGHDVVVILLRRYPTPSESHDGLCLRRDLSIAFKKGHFF